MHFLWVFFEIVGTIAFAISGALVGIHRKMDIFGIFVLALVTAIGGGIVRDLLVGRIPPNSLQTWLYVLLTIGSVLFLFYLYRAGWGYFFRAQGVQHIYLTADALGLASFTVTGASVGMTTNPGNLLIAILLGLVTAVGGGIIRDMLAQRTPSVLREEVYALPAILGSIFYFYAVTWSHPLIATYGTFIFVFVMRMLAIRYNWSLPKARKGKCRRQQKKELDS